MSVLIVCRANRCRSPLAAALLSRAADGALTVSSAGLLVSGIGVPDRGVGVAADGGVDVSTHRSRRVTAADLDEADLVLAVDGDVLRELVTDHSAQWAHVHTFGSLRRAQTAAPRLAHEGAREWIARVGAARERRELVELPSSDDVEDPFGRSTRTWRRVMARLEGETAAVWEALRPR
ncbi:low molecular weight phosphatase family protein [Demequina sp. NBRC 110053]|uniref:arsenate-mycothiol transferase ArsC n=1 Tax=Demequina sp. NBRC 110053 TaxID=1570342 RepID=UPI0013563EED|nr:hypothetical protein [Demequina sp. NBRC 110053]